MPDLKVPFFWWQNAVHCRTAALLAFSLLSAAPAAALEVDLNNKAKATNHFLWLADMSLLHLNKAKAAKIANNKTEFCYEVSQANHYVIQMDDIARQVSRSWFNTPGWEMAVRINKTSGIHTRAIDDLKAVGKCTD